ncbi:transporter substrate-binding domain-containing protein [Allopusillimonas soli]|uniref:Transporter substrate-binding domain-containing protein n=1 Tax=Allopusillimonas soli TaxID=659016 RepID=A0A853FDB2_9BURK|nr:transporter substrate-binding domain-containing protein [Allopusillimonas soli]NYT36521.1 transporter substrate-binding domain-containing protein [Allopusillimonas soli]TEA75022.1 transporter substrate-binding domain-containing protein [Allopusillimonas soli]
MKRMFSVFGCAALVLASVGLLWTSEPEAQATPLAVGLNYVVPPFVPGAKPRTPESPDETLAAQLAEKLGAKEVDARRISAGSVPADIAKGEVDIALLPLSSGRQQALSDAGMAIVPTGYVARPMAIMRSDTDIKSWEQLKGRTVCLSEGGLYTGHIASQYGAVELVKRAPADSLLALRTGGCDAAVHDAYMLNTLLAYPEWKKFSATLPPGPKRDLVFVASRDNAKAVAALHSLTRGWRGKHYLDELNETRVRDIAFEVYLDQEVPDCH